MYKEYRNEDGQLHKDDGPALILSSGLKGWFKNGKKHREDGPAIIYPSGLQEYWVSEKRYYDLLSYYVAVKEYQRNVR